MGRLHPEFHEPVTETLLNFIEELIYKIEKNPNYDPNKAINEFIEKYETKRKKIKHNFSDQLINDVIHIITGILEANEDYFINVLKKNRSKLIDCCVDFFIERYKSFYPNIEIKDENEYFKRQYRSILYALNRLKSSQSSMNKLEKWLKEQLKENWKLIESNWDDFNENKINPFEFLKKAIEILGEDLIFNLINYNPEIQEILLKRFG